MWGTIGQRWLRAITSLPASVREARSRNIFSEAAAIAFFSILSIFPLLLVLLMISFQFGAWAQTWQEALVLTRTLVPPSVARVISDYYSYSRDISSVGLFSASFVSALWLSTFSFQETIKAVRRIVVLPRRSDPWARSIGLFLMFYIFFAGILSVHLMAVGTWVLALLAHFEIISVFSSVLLYLVRWFFILGFIFSSVLFIYAIARNDISTLHQNVPGASLFSVSWILVTRLFIWYFGLFDAHRVLFGAISSMFLTMVWIYAMCLLLLFCAIYNDVYTGTWKKT